MSLAIAGAGEIHAGAGDRDGSADDVKDSGGRQRHASSVFASLGNSIFECNRIICATVALERTNLGEGRESAKQNRNQGSNQGRPLRFQFARPSQILNRESSAFASSR